MKEFNKGLLVAAGLALFGKSMYEIGKRRERKDTGESLNELKTKTGEIVKALKGEES